MSHTMLRRLGITLFLTLALTAAELDSQLDPLVRQIRQEVQPEQAMDFMRRIHATDRWFTFPKFQETATYLVGVLHEIGLSKVELLNAPADGVTQYGFWTMPMAWDAKSARLEIIEPALPVNQRVLADYQRVPVSLGMWSGPTPAGGVVAEVVEMATDSPAEWQKLDMKGKLVMTRPNLLPDTKSLKWILVKKGALGAINAFTENPDLQDDRHWVNFWGDSGWAFTRRSTPLLCFSITPRQSALLHELLIGRRRVRVKAVADTRYYSGVYPYVTGVLAGADGREEVLELGHTSEQGACDNATGVAAMLEALATLNRLIASGKLNRPRRGIRILAMGEMYPSMHYIATHPERMRNTVAAMCVDTAAGPYELSGTEYSFHLNPDIARSFVDALIARVARAYFPHLTPVRAFHIAPYHTGTDGYLPDPMIGVPTVLPKSGTGIRTHHNSADTPDRVDARSLRDLSIVIAAFLYAVADAGETQAPWLAQAAADRGLEQVRQAGSRARVAYTVDRESQAARSVMRLVPPDRRSAVQARIEPLIAKLETRGRERAQLLPDVPEPAPPADARTIVVTRKRFGTIPMDDLPVEEWEGYPYGSWALVPVTALYWCDGRRSLAEVIHLTRMEYDVKDFDFVGYFRFLARHGYVQLRETK